MTNDRKMIFKEYFYESVTTFEKFCHMTSVSGHYFGLQQTNTCIWAWYVYVVVSNLSYHRYIIIIHKSYHDRYIIDSADKRWVFRWVH